MASFDKKVIKANFIASAKAVDHRLAQSHGEHLKSLSLPSHFSIPLGRYWNKIDWPAIRAWFIDHCSQQVTLGKDDFQTKAPLKAIIVDDLMAGTIAYTFEQLIPQMSSSAFKKDKAQREVLALLTGASADNNLDLSTTELMKDIWLMIVKASENEQGCPEECKAALAEEQLETVERTKRARQLEIQFRLENRRRKATEMGDRERTRSPPRRPRERIMSPPHDGEGDEDQRQTLRHVFASRSAPMVTTLENGQKRDSNRPRASDFFIPEQHGSHEHRDYSFVFNGHQEFYHSMSSSRYYLSDYERGDHYQTKQPSKCSDDKKER